MALFGLGGACGDDGGAVVADATGPTREPAVSTSSVDSTSGFPTGTADSMRGSTGPADGGSTTGADGGSSGDAGEDTTGGPLECRVGAADCNDDPVDGCETDLTSTDAHCGGCGVDCEGGTCTDGACSSFQLAEWFFANGLVVDDSHAHWSSLGSANVARVPVAGGAAPQILAEGFAEPSWLGEHGDELVVHAFGESQAYRFPKTGGPPVVVADVGHGYVPLALVDGFVYRGLGTVSRAPAGGGDFVDLTADLGSIRAIAVTTTEVVVAIEDGTVSSLAPEGGPPTELCTVPNPVTRATIEGTDALIATEVGEVFACALLGGPAVELVPGVPPDWIDAITANADEVFYVTTAGELRVAPRAGGASALLATCPASSLTTIVRTSDAVYWTAIDGVYKVVRPQ